MNGEAGWVAFWIALAAVIIAIVLKQSPKPVLTDPLAQRIHACSSIHNKRKLIEVYAKEVEAKKGKTKIQRSNF